MGPAQFGIVSVSITCVLLLDAVFGSAIDMAIFRLAPLHRETAPLRARQIEKAGLLLKPIASLVLLTPFIIFLPQISKALFQSEAHKTVLLIAFGALLGLLMFRSMQVHFQNERRFVAYGVSDLLHTVARYGSIGVLLVLGFVTPEAILGAYLLAAFTVTAIGLHWWTRPVLKAPFSLDAAAQLGGVLRWFVPAVVAGSIASRMDVFFVSTLGGVGEAGIYGAAQMFALVPQLFGTYASAVFSPRILPMWRAGKLVRTYFRSQAMLLAIAVCAYVIVLLAIGPLGSRLLPAGYQRSQTVILLLVPAGLASLVNFPFTIPLLLYTHARLILTADLIGIPLAAAAYLFAVPGRGAVAAAAVTASIALLRLLFYQGLAWRMLRRDPRGDAWSAAAGAMGSGSFEGVHA